MMTNEVIVLCMLFGMFVGFLVLFLLMILEDYFAPRFSQMGSWPSRYEERQQRIRDAKASYKEEYIGVVPVKTYRWSGEKDINIRMGWPTICIGYKTVRYRKEFNSDEWIPYEEKINTKKYEGYWFVINDLKNFIIEKQTIGAVV